MSDVTAETRPSEQDWAKALGVAGIPANYELRRRVQAAAAPLVAAERADAARQERERIKTAIESLDRWTDDSEWVVSREHALAAIEEET